MTTRAIIVVDVQEEYFEGPLAIHYPDRTVSESNIERILALAGEQTMPVAVIEHEAPEGFPVFAPGSTGRLVRASVASWCDRYSEAWTSSVKSVSSALADDALVEWLRAAGVDTLTVVGYMTNNCVLATAAHAELLGFAVEVISDATGAIHMANSAGSASAQQVHETLMVLLNSNWAAVVSTDEWAHHVAEGDACNPSNLVETALQGSQLFNQ